MKRGFVLLAIMLLIAGCAGVKTSAPITVCDQFAGPSLIEKYIPDMRSASTLIKLSVYEVSKLKEVQKKDIVKVLDEIDAMAGTATTYNQLFVYISSKVKYIRENMGAEIMIIGDDLLLFQDVATPISPKDFCYIKYQISEIRLKVLPWITAK
jgi:hypothetical protein